jgi:hypothetical protein
MRNMDIMFSMEKNTKMEKGNDIQTQDHEK